MRIDIGEYQIRSFRPDDSSALAKYANNRKVRTCSNPVRGRNSSAKQNDAEERHEDEHSQHIGHG